MANTDYRSEHLVSSIRLMIGRRVAGLAAIISEMAPDLIEELSGSRVPAVSTMWARRGRTSPTFG
ncbi:MAG TPA: hypothetical protein VMB03_02455 [Bryobacteraceae bacterium]|nr:hypothetical protein [Bryobacteraceae bacterium]